MTTAPQKVQDAELGILVPLPEMDDVQFRQWTELLEQRTGTVLPPERKSFLVTSLGLRMREIGCECYQEYYDTLNSGVSGALEWSTLVDRLTVHETRFFRHPSSMELVRQQVCETIRRGVGRAKSIHAWSVGCSTGEEAYTLAMVIDRSVRAAGVRDAYFGVLGSDISQPSLQVGRRGIYNARRMKDVDADLRKEYFEALDDGRFQIHGELRKRVCFARLNILDIEREPLAEMDIIYCQNVLIYFDRARRKQIVERLAERLRPGGLLILGSGELMTWCHPDMDKVQCAHTLAFQRRVLAGNAEA